MFYTDFKHNVLLDVVKTEVTSPYGMRLLFGVYKMHNGIDLKPIAKVIAYQKGLVIAVSYTAISGYLITLQHKGATTTYRHLAKGSTIVKVGQIVKRGEIMALVGATGTVTGAHLHFDIKVNGIWVDPLPYLQGTMDLLPYEEVRYTMNRPTLPMLKVLVPNLYYRDKPNGERILHLEEKSYPYLGKSLMIGGYEWAQIILKDDEIVWVGLAPTLNQIVPIPPVIVTVEKEVIKIVEKAIPFHAELDKDGQHLIIDLKPIEGK